MTELLTIEQCAAAWLHKRDSGEWTDNDQAELNAWLEDTYNRIAYLRLEAAWEEMNRLQALGAGHPRGYVPAAEELEASSWRAVKGAVKDFGQEKSEKSASTAAPTRAARLAIAASLLLAALGIAAYYGADSLRGERYATPTGGIATIPLKDGSNITLSTASNVRVQLGETERHINLAQGEAFFEVAHDPTRPFVVQARDKRITAVGTKFSVRLDDDNVRVVVTEGKVKFEGREGASFLTAGAIARATEKSVQVETVALPAAEEQLSWRTGYVIFHETPLADAVAEFNRYNERKIFIDDPALAAMQLSGKFRSTNIDSFTTLLEQSFGISVQVDGDRIELSERK